MKLSSVGSSTTSINVVKNTNNNITEFKLNSITITDDTITFNATIILKNSDPSTQKYYFKINTIKSPPPISYLLNKTNTFDFTINLITTPPYTKDILSKGLTLNILDDVIKSTYNTYKINIPLYTKFEKIINFDEVNLTYINNPNKIEYSISKSEIEATYNKNDGNEPYLHKYNGNIKVNNIQLYNGGQSTTPWDNTSPQPFYYTQKILFGYEWKFNNTKITFTLNTPPSDYLITHAITINNLPIEDFTDTQPKSQTITLTSTKTNYNFLLNKIKNIFDNATISSTAFYGEYYNYNLSTDYLTLRDIEISGLQFNPSSVIKITNINADMNRNSSNTSTNIFPLTITGNSVTIPELNFNLTNISATEVPCNFIITYSITINSRDFKDQKSNSIPINNGGKIKKIKNLLPDNFDDNGYGFRLPTTSPPSTPSPITLDNSTIDKFKPLVKNDSIFTATPSNLFTVDFKYNRTTITASNISNTDPSYILNFNIPIVNEYITQNITFNQDLVYETTTPYTVQFKSNENNFLDLFNKTIQDIIDNATITTKSITVESKNYYNYNLSTNYLTLRNINITYKTDLPINNNISITKINAKIENTSSDTYTTSLPSNIYGKSINIHILNFLNSKENGIGNNDAVCEFTITYSINNNSYTKISKPIKINPIENTASPQQFYTIGVLSKELPSNFDTYGFKNATIILDNSTLNNFKPTVQGDSIFKSSSINLLYNVNFLYGSNTSSSYSITQNNYTVTFNQQTFISYNVPLIQQITYNPDILDENNKPPIITITNNKADLLEKYIQEPKNTPILISNINTSIIPNYFIGTINIDTSKYDTSLSNKYPYSIYLYTSTNNNETNPPSTPGTKILSNSNGIDIPSSIKIDIANKYFYGDNKFMYIYIGYEIPITTTTQATTTTVYTVLSNYKSISTTKPILPPTINSVKNNNTLINNLTGEINITAPKPDADKYSIYYKFSSSNQPPTNTSDISKNVLKDDSKTTLTNYVISQTKSLIYTGNDVYIYIIIGVKYDSSIVYSEFSKPIMIPKISIQVPKNIYYSNFWPYSFDMNTDGKPVNLNYVSCGPVEIDYSNEPNDENIYTGEGFIIYRDTFTKLDSPTKSDFYNRLQVMNDGDSIWIKKNDADYPDHNLIDSSGNKEKVLIYSLSSVSTGNTTSINADPFSSSFDYTTFKPVQFPLKYDFTNGSPLYYIGDNYAKFNTDVLSFPLTGVCTDLSTITCKKTTDSIEFTNIRVYDRSLDSTIISNNKNYFNWYINEVSSSISNYLTISSKFDNDQDNTITYCSSTISTLPDAYVGSETKNNELFIQFSNDRKNYKPLDLTKNNLNSGNSMTIQLTNSQRRYLSVVNTTDVSKNCLTNSSDFKVWQYAQFLPNNSVNKPHWTFINRTPIEPPTDKNINNSIYKSSRMHVSSWGYSRTSKTSNKDGISSNTSDIIFNSNSTQFNLSFRDNLTTIKGNLNSYYIKDNDNHLETNFANYITQPTGSELDISYTTIKNNITNNNKIQTISIQAKNKNISYNNLYMAVIPFLNSVFYTKSDATPNPSKDKKEIDSKLNNLIQKLSNNSNDPIFTIQPLILDNTFQYNPTEEDDTLVTDKAEICSNNNKYYFRFEPSIPSKDNKLLPIYNTTTINDTNLNKSIIYIKGSETIAIESNSGDGGNMKCLYIGSDKNNLTDITNVISIAGGGGGGGVYSKKDSISDLDNTYIPTGKYAFDGEDGIGLYNKNLVNTPITYTPKLNNMNGGSAACHKGNTSYKINASCIGGTVHTFKNEKTDAEKKEWYFKADNNNINSGYYPQINSKEEIISSKINGYSYITGNIDTISYDNTNYLIDSNSAQETDNTKLGNGGSADNSNNQPIVVNQWGASNGYVNFGNDIDTSINITKTYTKNNWNTYSTPLYYRGGGGGGGFGGGSAGGYFYYETLLETPLETSLETSLETPLEKNKSYQQLSNVPPGGGGGGNSFYNKETFQNGYAYGIDKKTTTYFQHKEDDTPIPSLLTQLLNLSRHDLVDKIKKNSSYTKGDDENSYIYLYNS